MTPSIHAFDLAKYSIDPTRLYILEKCWRTAGKGFVFDPAAFDFVLIRPCNVSYEVYKKFMLGKKTHCREVIHEGAIASWYSPRLHWIESSTSYEEFMVNLNLNKQVVPLIENWQIDLDFKTYTVKTIDLKTGKTLYDKVDAWLSENRKRNLI